MATIRTVTVKPSGGDYTSLAAAEAGEQGDLVALDRQLTIECHSMADSAQVTFDGWTTDATRYIRVVAPAGERHAGAWDASKYRLELSTTGTPGGCLANREDYTRIEGLQVRNTLAAPGQFNSAIYSESRCVVDSCITRGGYAGIDMSGGNATVRNSIAYGGTRGGLSANGASGPNTWQNCTLIGTDSGLSVSASGVYAVATNVYAHGGTYGFTSGGAADGGIVTKTNCASGDTTAANNSQGGGATGCLNSVPHSTATFASVTAGSEDYHLAAGSALIDAGADLSGSFAADIDGATRGETWDIGADEFAGGSVVARSSLAGMGRPGGGVAHSLGC